jgi:hypothetical protein
MAIVALAMLAGCGERLMPTPVVFGVDRVDPFTATPAENADPETVVYLASTRAPGPRGEGRSWDRFYTNDRGEHVLLAKATVRIGDPRGDWETLREASLARPRRGNMPLVLTGIEEYGPLYVSVRPREMQVVRARRPAFEMVLDAPPELRVPAQRFLEDVNAQLARSEQADIYIYIHGFNTGFAENTGVAASIWHFLGRNGVMISYAWPSRNSTFAYGRDLATAQANDLDFRVFLWFLHEQTTAERIHVIAHSAGSPVVVRALEALRLQLQETDPVDIEAASRVGQVVLAAPDMDVAHFGNAIFDGFDQIPDGVTIYVNTDDGALGLSRLVHGFARLGSPTDMLGPDDFESIRGSDTLTIIDVAEAQDVHGSLLGHGYFIDNPWVSADWLMLLRYGALPADRGLVRDEETAMWVFPEDHADSVVPPARALSGHAP